MKAMLTEPELIRPMISADIPIYTEKPFCSCMTHYDSGEPTPYAVCKSIVVLTVRDLKFYEDVYSCAECANKLLTKRRNRRAA